MKWLGNVGLFIAGVGVLLHGIGYCCDVLVRAGVDVCEEDFNKIGLGQPPGSYEDDTEWDLPDNEP